MKVLGIAGSLREGSYNRGLLRAARELLPEGVELVEFDIREPAVLRRRRRGCRRSRARHAR